MWRLFYGVLSFFLLLLFLVTMFTAYMSPDSRLYATPFGYPALKRFLNIPIPVQTVAVEQRTMTKTISASGTVRHLNEVPVNVEVVGVVTEVSVQPGDSVGRGEVLFRLNSGGYLSTISELDVQLKESQYIKAKQDYEREANAFAQGLISSATLDQFSQRVKEAQIALDKAKEDYENSLRSRSERVTDNSRAKKSSLPRNTQIDVVSPLSGTILSQNIFPGMNLVSPTNKAMVIGDQLVFKAALDQRYRASVEKGQVATIYLQAYPEHSLTGEIIRIGNRIVDQLSSRKDDIPYTFDVWLAFPNTLPQGVTLLSGMSGYCVLQNSFEAVAVPESALLRYSGQKGLVMGVNDKGEVHLVPVSYTVNAEGYVAITSGLRVGDRVIVKGQMALQEGDKVIAQ
jgi:RND family efflux transporter MFP subunit